MKGCRPLLRLAGCEERLWHHVECWDDLGQCGVCKRVEALRFGVGKKPSTARCPQCSERLATCEYEAISLLLCDTCWAFWASASSLRALLFQVAWDVGAPERHAPEPRLEPNLTCFECGRTCRMAAWGDLVFDVCPGHGAWFESGELVALRARMHEDAVAGLALLEIILDRPISREGEIPGGDKSLD